MHGAWTWPNNKDLIKKNTILLSIFSPGVHKAVDDGVVVRVGHSQTAKVVLLSMLSPGVERVGYG